MVKLIRLSFLFAAIFFSFSAQAQTAIKEWTFLIYMNGHNDLSDFTEMNLRDLEKVGSTKDINIIVEWGSIQSNLTKRLYVEKTKNNSQITSPVLMEMEGYDMGDYKNLLSFIQWGIQNYPAKRYFVNVWNHGAGWYSLNNKNMQRKDFRPFDISFDDTTRNYISTEQMGLVMKEASRFLGRNIDIYGNDACLMSMVEVVGEVKGAVDYFVGSQDLEPGEGWPYYSFIKKWSENPYVKTSDLLKILTDEYIKAYTQKGVYGERDGITLSVFDLSKLDHLYSQISRLKNYLIQQQSKVLVQVRRAVLDSLRFGHSDYVDLGNFVEKLNELSLLKSESYFFEDFNSAYKDFVIYSQSDKKRNKEATGLSIWIPLTSNRHQARYSQLLFSQETGWNEFTDLITRIQ